MDWKTTAVMSGFGIVATWMASAPLVPPRAPVGSVPVPPTTQVVASPIEQEAARLARGLDLQARPGPPSRNPFRFGVATPAPTVAPAASVVPAAAAAPTAAAHAVPSLSLAGIAEDVVEGTIVRTAILSGPSGIVLARVGDVVTEGYRVSSIEAGAVELAADGAVPLTLSLTP